MAEILYKYLDVEGGLKMLKYSNLQFTNATRLNDPFDCHPSLIDFSKVPLRRMKYWDKDIIISLEKNRYERFRDKAWICSLSKVHDSLLMWSYYGAHKGVCIGLDMTKANQYLSQIRCAVRFGSSQFEVQYKEVLEKPDFFQGAKDFYRYQLSTKSKAWEHEQEVRLVLIDPHYGFVHMQTPYKPKEGDRIDWKEMRAYPKIGGECFKSLYLGVNIDKDEKDKIIKYARITNPDINIYQMTVDPDAFRLKEVLIVD